MSLLLHTVWTVLNCRPNWLLKIIRFTIWRDNWINYCRSIIIWVNYMKIWESNMIWSWTSWMSKMSLIVLSRHIIWIQNSHLILLIVREIIIITGEYLDRVIVVMVNIIFNKIMNIMSIIMNSNIKIIIIIHIINRKCWKR